MKAFLLFAAMVLGLLLFAESAQAQCQRGGGTQGTAATAALASSGSTGASSFGYNMPTTSPMQMQAVSQIQVYAQQRAIQLAQRAQRNKERHARQIATHTQRRLEEESRRRERRKYVSASLSSQ
jgi:hypothetical protein